MPVTSGPEARDDYHAALGAAIRKHRTAKGLSQEALAEAAGVYRSHVSTLELGKVTPTVAVLRSVAEALETTADALLRQAERTLARRPVKGTRPRRGKASR